MFPVLPERPVVLTELFASVFGKRTARAEGEVRVGGAPFHPNLFMTS